MVIVVAVACAGAPAQRAPTAPPPEDARVYYPLELGWRWAYDIERGPPGRGDNMLAIYTVSGREGGTAHVSAGGETLSYDVSPEGIARAQPALESDKRTPELDFLLRSPVRAGASWPITDGVAKITAHGKTVTVPAGTYDNTVTVEESRERPTRLVRTTYAPGVGPISVESLVLLPGSRNYDSNLRATLRGLTRPGESATGN